MASNDANRSQLALHGGPPVFPTGPPAWPAHELEVRETLAAAWEDGSWGRYSGPHGERLREHLAAYHDVPHVKLCCSGTIGVELALRAVGIQPDDEVILAAYDFPGNFRAIERIGARPVLVDIDPQSLSLDLEQLESAMGPQTRAVLVSHLHSGIAPMAAIVERAWRCGCHVIEDACQAHGARVDGRPAGSWGDVAVLSFGGSKLITAGRGGAVLLRRADHFQRLVIYSDQGNDAYPLSELQAAVVWPQWQRLEERNRRRRESVRRLIGALADFAELQYAGMPQQWDQPSYYKTAWWWVADARPGLTREEFCQAMRAEGVAMDVGFRGFAKRSERRCRRAGDLCVARRAAEQLIVLHHPILLEPAEMIDGVRRAAAKVLFK